MAGNGDRLVPLGSRLVIHVWGTVSSVSASQTVLDKTANLMKYRQQNVKGAISFDRTSTESSVAAGLQLTKGVASRQWNDPVRSDDVTALEVLRHQP